MSVGHRTTTTPVVRMLVVGMVRMVVRMVRIEKGGHPHPPHAHVRVWPVRMMRVVRWWWGWHHVVVMRMVRRRRRSVVEWMVRRWIHAHAGWRPVRSHFMVVGRGMMVRVMRMVGRVQVVLLLRVRWCSWRGRCVVPVGILAVLRLPSFFTCSSSTVSFSVLVVVAAAAFVVVIVVFVVVAVVVVVVVVVAAAALGLG